MSLINLLASTRSALAQRRQRRRALDELMALDDRSLADIGIHRSQIPSMVMSFEQAVQLEAAPVAAHATALSRSAGLVAGHR
jgi:uncharacterized protein YjiS (DUF1127 family)